MNGAAPHAAPHSAARQHGKRNDTDRTPARNRLLATYLQVAPLTIVLIFFFLVPVALVVVVSFFRYQMLVGIVPDFTLQATTSTC